MLFSHAKKSPAPTSFYNKTKLKTSTFTSTKPKTTPPKHAHPPKTKQTHSPNLKSIYHQFKPTNKTSQNPRKPSNTHHKTTSTNPSNKPIANNSQKFKDQSTSILHFRDQYGWFTISKPQSKPKTTSSTQPQATQSRSKVPVNKTSFVNSSSNDKFSSTGYKRLSKGLQWVSTHVLNARYVKSAANTYLLKKSYVLDDCNSFVPKGKKHVLHA